MKTHVHLWSYIAECFIGWEMFRKKFVEKIKTQILYLIFIRNFCLFLGNVKKYSTA
jgi:hypothetical protein